MSSSGLEKKVDHAEKDKPNELEVPKDITDKLKDQLDASTEMGKKTQLGEALAESEAFQAESKDFQTKIEALQQDLATQKIEAEALQAKAQAEHEDLKHKTKDQLEAMETQLAAAKDETKALQAKSKAQFEAAQAQFQAESEYNQATIQALTDQKIELEESKAKAKAEFEALQARSKAEFEAFQEKIKALEQELTTQKAESEALHARYNQAEYKNLKHNDTLETHEAHEALVTQLEVANNDYESVLQERAAIGERATRFVMLSNLFDIGDEMSDMWNEEIERDVSTVSDNYGGATYIFVDVCSQEGNVYVKMASIHAAILLYEQFNGTIYRHRRTIAQFISELLFETLFPGLNYCDGMEIWRNTEDMCELLDHQNHLANTVEFLQRELELAEIRIQDLTTRLGVDESTTQASVVQTAGYDLVHSTEAPTAQTDRRNVTTLTAGYDLVHSTEAPAAQTDRRNVTTLVAMYEELYGNTQKTMSNAYVQIERGQNPLSNSESSTLSRPIRNESVTSTIYQSIEVNQICTEKEYNEELLKLDLEKAGLRASGNRGSLLEVLARQICANPKVLSELLKGCLEREYRGDRRLEHMLSSEILEKLSHLLQRPIYIHSIGNNDIFGVQYSKEGIHLVYINDGLYDGTKTM